MFSVCSFVNKNGIFLLVALHLKCIYLFLMSFGNKFEYFFSKLFFLQIPKHFVQPILFSVILSLRTLNFLLQIVHIQLKYILFGIDKSILFTYKEPIVLPIYSLYLFNVFSL